METKEMFAVKDQMIESLQQKQQLLQQEFQTNKQRFDQIDWD